MRLHIKSDDGVIHQCEIADLDRPTEKLLVTGFIITGKVGDGFFKGEVSMVRYTEERTDEGEPIKEEVNFKGQFNKLEIEIEEIE